MKVYTVYPCVHCGHPAPEGLRSHLECAMEATSRQIAARARAEPERERREERAKLDAAALAATRIERTRIVELLRGQARALREEGGRCTLAETLVALAQRAAALDEAATLIEGEAP